MRSRRTRVQVEAVPREEDAVKKVAERTRVKQTARLARGPTLSSSLLFLRSYPDISLWSGSVGRCVTGDMAMIPCLEFWYR